MSGTCARFVVPWAGLDAGAAGADVDAGSSGVDVSNRASASFSVSSLQRSVLSSHQAASLPEQRLANLNRFVDSSVQLGDRAANFSSHLNRDFICVDSHDNLQGSCEQRFLLAHSPHRRPHCRRPAFASSRSCPPLCCLPCAGPVFEMVECTIRGRTPSSRIRRSPATSSEVSTIAVAAVLPVRCLASR